MKKKILHVKVMEITKIALKTLVVKKVKILKQIL